MRRSCHAVFSQVSAGRYAGTGSASRISIGTVVFSGLLVSSWLSLFVIPAVYLLLKRQTQKSHPAVANS